MTTASAMTSGALHHQPPGGSRGHQLALPRRRPLYRNRASGRRSLPISVRPDAQPAISGQRGRRPSTALCAKPARKRGRLVYCQIWPRGPAEVAIPLIEAWSGLPADQVSAAVGDSIPVQYCETLFLSVARKVMRRAIAIGYSRDVKASVNVWHVYPQGGLSLLCQKLADPCSDSIESVCWSRRSTWTTRVRWASVSMARTLTPQQ